MRKILSKIKRRLLNAKEIFDYRRRCAMGGDIRLRPAVTCETRTFGTGDGAWTVAVTDCQKPLVYSFGVGLDISFDAEVIKSLGATVAAFDPTPISNEWLKAQTVPANFHFYPWGIADFDGEADFILPENHVVSFTILHSEGKRYKCPVYKLPTIMHKLGHTRVDILKIDIEGAEYGIIDDIVRLENSIGQVLIEFHHRMLPLPESLDLTRQAVSKLSDAGFKLFHTSPRGLEYCFIRKY